MTQLIDAAPAPIDAVVLFTGRGGSGTRLLSQFAADAGIFIGNHVNKSGDSIEWIDLVYRMVLQTAGQHDLPSGSEFRQAIRERAQHILGDGPLCRSGLWGLKLPETMLVLPLLIDAFPHAKVVHLTRHPVSSSLRRTHITSRLDNPIGAVALPAAYRYANRDAGEIATDAPYLHNAYAWNFQVSRVVRYARDVLGAARYLEIRYEDVCAQPDGVLAFVQSYLGCADQQVATSIQVDISRASTWDPRDPRVETIWEICGETAALLGYTRELAVSSRTRSHHRAPPPQGGHE
jgi:Sulfotransferase family